MYTFHTPKRRYDMATAEGKGKNTLMVRSVLVALYCASAYRLRWPACRFRRQTGFIQRR
jgi:hypothetical protein